MLRAAMLFLMLVVPACFAHADGASYASVPRVTAVDPTVFKSVFERSRTEVLRVTILGDSQETAPWGWGEHYIAQLNARFAKVYGPSGESQLFTNHTSIARPMWLGTMEQSTATIPTTVAEDRVSAGLTVEALLASGGAPTGFARTVLLHDASFCASDTLEGGPWLDAKGPFVADVLAIERPGSAGLRWTNAPTDGDIPTATAEVLQRGSFPASSKIKSERFAWFTTPPLQFGARRHLQLALEGDSPKIGCDVVGVRFRSLGAPTGVPTGVVVQSFARGGMRLIHLTQEHGQSGAFLRAHAPGVIVLQYGANDAGYITSLEQWRAQLLEAIQWIRAQLKDPAFPIIIAGELLGAGGNQFEAIVDGMPVIAHEIALQDSHVLALNLRRIAEEEYGWGPSMLYMADTAHHHPYAQSARAEAFVGELTRTLDISDPACAAPNWADCVRVWGARCAQGGCRLTTDMEVVAHGLSWQGPGTSCADGDGDGWSDECPPGGPNDLNHDGFVDGMDLAILLSAWGQSNHPADLDGDGTVGAADLSVFLAAWP